MVKNVISYGFKVSLIIIRGARDYEPLKFFGLTGLYMVGVGIISSIALFVRWLLISRIDPYLIVAYANVFVVIVGSLLIILGLIADMLDRNRQLQEEVLYRIKKNEYTKKI